MSNRAGMSRLFLPVLLTCTILGILVLRFGFIFLLLAMMPSVMAYYMKSDTNHSVFKTVFACNLAGALPFIVPMIQAGLKFKHYDIAPIIGAPHVWLIVYSAAAAGWCVIFLSRFIARFALTMIYEYRVVALEKMQEKLKEEWGDRLLHQHTATK